MVKVASVFPGNLEREMATINGAVLVLDPETGVPEAVMDAGSLTAIRTAAASGLATRLLAPRDARVLAVIGAGGTGKVAACSGVCGATDQGGAGVFADRRARE
jgi:ornithine cyclodeaminase